MSGFGACCTASFLLSNSFFPSPVSVCPKYVTLGLHNWSLCCDTLCPWLDDVILSELALQSFCVLPVIRMSSTYKRYCPGAGNVHSDIDFFNDSAYKVGLFWKP